MKTVKLPKSVEQTKSLIGFLLYFQKFTPSLAEELQTFFKLLRKTTTFIFKVRLSQKP